jgi:Uma2 family endonuclease
MAQSLGVKMTYDEYLAFESASTEKHELVDGELRARSGGSYAHSRVSANAIAGLAIALRGSEWRALGNDMRVRTGDDAGTYPDVSVVGCEPRFTDDTEDELRNPRVIVEVLSPSTEAYDRGDNFVHYQTIESLRDYVLVSTSTKRVDVFTRGEGSWTLRSYVAGASVELPSLSVSLAVDDLYKNALAPKRKRRPGRSHERRSPRREGASDHIALMIASPNSEHFTSFAPSISRAKS